MEKNTMETIHINECKSLEFILHGVKQTIDTSGLKPETTLNQYLRDFLHLTGTKYMCREGGCGVCIVAVSAKNPRTGVKETFAVNSCLVSILSCGGWEITTAEGLGNRAEGYHPIQQTIVKFNGTQCGFCTPGMVMNMHAQQESGNDTMAEIENAFAGNICRCTGYRPILSAFKSMASDSDVNVIGIVPDIEELKLCKKENCEKTCPIPCNVNISTPIVYDMSEHNGQDLPMTDNKNWFKVTTIDDIFKVMHAQQKLTYNLVAGNTAKGVYEDMSTADYYIDVSGVPELRTYSHNTKKLILGGNCTLSETMKIFKEVANGDDGFKHLLTVVQHIDLVATVPVRNIGTIAGNLSIKYIHNEFPSDIFVLLEIIKANIILDNGSKQQTVTPQQYLATNMDKRIIRRVEIPPLDASYKFETYKIMPKSQNAHAHVNAGFLFKMNRSNVVESANIVFGGINPDFVHATKTEKYIIGKQLFNNTNMQNLFAKLNTELVPDYVLPDPTPEFRKNLAMALMYKFILSIAPETMIQGINKSGGQKLIRPAVSKGVQDYKTNTSMYPIGEPVNKIEAADQAAGEAKYIFDLPDLPNQTYAAFVLAQAPAGSTLKKIDPAKAKELDGVEGFFQASDIEDMGGKNSFTPSSTTNLPEDELIFVPIDSQVQYYFQPIGIIIAKNQKLAEKAAQLVEVEYTDSTTSPLLNVRDVLSHNEEERITHDSTIIPKHQDLTVPNKIEGKFDVSWQYHYHMECQIVNVAPDDDGGIIMYPATQWMDSVQASIVGALNIPSHKISISVKRIGGSYGAKITRTNLLACAATLAVLKLRKPVKLWLPLETNMNVIGKRNPASANYEVGFDNDGKIGYINQTIYTDVGLHPTDLPKDSILDLFMNTYNSDAMQVDYNWVRTDNHTASWTRAPGSTEGLAMIETIMEHMSYKLKKDPLDVKLANLNTTKHPLLETFMNDFLTWSDYRARRTEIETFNTSNRWRKRGIALVPMAYSLVLMENHHAQVSIYQADGTVAISHGGIELGQGINTKAVQLVAYVLGIDMDLISVKPSNNFTAPNNTTTGGSQTSESVCFALQKSCEILKKRIDDAATAADLPDDAPWDVKVKNAHVNGVSLTSSDMFIDNPDDSREYIIYAISATEVEVDILTGNYIIQRVDLLEDAGDSMSPFIDIGQCEGAFVMGLGYWTSEEIIMDHDGQLKTNRTWTYKPPGAKDIPVDFRVKFPEGVPNPLSPYKTKATGEPPLCVAFSVALAIRHAIGSARTQSDSSADPWTPINGPCTVEWTFLNSLNDYKQYKL